MTKKGVLHFTHIRHYDVIDLLYIFRLASCTAQGNATGDRSELAAGGSELRFNCLIAWVMASIQFLSIYAVGALSRSDWPLIAISGVIISKLLFCFVDLCTSVSYVNDAI